MSFSDAVVQQVWEKGSPAPPNDVNEWRKDECGAWIFRKSYGIQSEYGWEIDHITPVSSGGGDGLSNLRPLHWENNRAKADGRLGCAVTSDGNKNVRKT
jgi:hypothetical protein